MFFECIIINSNETLVVEKSADRFESTETGQQEGLNEGFILRKNYNLQKT